MPYRKQTISKSQILDFSRENFFRHDELDVTRAYLSKGWEYEKINITLLHQIRVHGEQKRKYAFSLWPLQANIFLAIRSGFQEQKIYFPNVINFTERKQRQRNQTVGDLKNKDGAAPRSGNFFKWCLLVPCRKQKCMN